MGMDLKNVEGGTERFGIAAWHSVLELAYEYDWKPTGTEPGAWVDPETGELDKQLSPDPDEWSGTYFSNDYQWVTEEDAAGIADALERALKDTPFGGKDRQKLSQFIAFCRVGAFFIA